MIVHLKGISILYPATFFNFSTLFSRTLVPLKIFKGVSRGRYKIMLKKLNFRDIESLKTPFILAFIMFYNTFSENEPRREFIFGDVRGKSL